MSIFMNLKKLHILPNLPDGIYLFSGKYYRYRVLYGVRWVGAYAYPVRQRRPQSYVVRVRDRVIGAVRALPPPGLRSPKQIAII